jgi:cytochrome c biogenesis protein CcdA/thiol-disulfide isomerase/thioredoxin
MLLILLAYAGGALTIVSPCILPVLPFVFARADKPFVRSGLPLLAGMAATFAAVATLAAVGGGWAVQANHDGRLAAIALLAVFGVTLLFPSVAERLTRPLVAFGNRLSQSADRGIEAGGSSIAASLLLGVATGLLWAPCAGPVLGLILTGAALQGASVGTTLLLLAYAAGAATSLALALLVGGRVFAAMKRSLGVGEWIRRGLGVAVLAACAVIALGWDTGFLARVSAASTASAEQELLDRFHATPVANTAMMAAIPAKMVQTVPASAPPGPLPAALPLPDEGAMPSLSGAVAWLNSPPLTQEALRGHVVLVDFWTFSCVNCLRSLPYVRAWADKYRDRGLIVIGVHAPEFAFEKSIPNVRAAVADLHIPYPVAIDNDYAIWRGFQNQYWPADYLIDANGRIRAHHFGEGDYDETERQIQQLLAASGHVTKQAALVNVQAAGVEAAADMQDVRSPETYIGYDRAQNFVSPGGSVNDAPHAYRNSTEQLNQWSLAGNWTIGAEHAVLNSKDGAITYCFHARDLNLVLGPRTDGGAVRFIVTIDGKPPAGSHGTDVAADGSGVVNSQRLYQLVRQSGAVTDRTFEIRFLDPGVNAYAFTFG